MPKLRDHKGKNLKKTSQTHMLKSPTAFFIGMRCHFVLIPVAHLTPDLSKNLYLQITLCQKGVFSSRSDSTKTLQVRRANQRRCSQVFTRTQRFVPRFVVSPEGVKLMPGYKTSNPSVLCREKPTVEPEGLQRCLLQNRPKCNPTHTFCVEFNLWNFWEKSGPISKINLPHQGSILWSQFSAIFVNFRRK
jgi:hypothetical protein